MYYGFNQLHTLEIDEWISQQKGGHFQYLTNQGLVLAGITMVLSFLADLMPLRPLRRLKRSLLIIALPVRVTHAPKDAHYESNHPISSLWS